MSGQEDVFRHTRAGRLVKVYQPANSIATGGSDPPSSEDGHSPSKHDYRDYDLHEVQRVLQRYGFNSGWDLALAQLRSKDAKARGWSNSFFKDGGSTTLLELLGSEIPLSVSEEDTICALAFEMVGKEFRELNKSNTLHCIQRQLTVDDAMQFTLHGIWEEVKDKSPRLLWLFESMMFDDVAGSRPLNPDPEVALISSEHQVPAFGRAHLSLRTNTTRMNALVTSLSSLLYGHSQKCNLLPTHIAQFLYAIKAPRLCIDILSRLGICVSTQSLLRGVRSLADSSKMEMRTLVSSHPAFVLCHDNMDFYDHVRHQQLNNQSELRHWTVGWVGLNLRTREPIIPPRMFNNSDSDIARLRMFTERDLILSTEDTRSNLRSYRGTICDALSRYFRNDMSQRLDITTKRPLEHYKPPAIHQIPVQKTLILPFPAMDENEATHTGTINILEKMAQMLCLDERTLRRAKIMHFGDYLTLSTIR